MKKAFAVLLSLLLIVSFVFMALPGSLWELMVQLKDRDGGLRFSSPSYDDDISFYYKYFVMDILDPLSLMEKDLKRLIDEKYAEKDIQIELNILETELNDLNTTPKFHHDLFEPAYETASELKSQLVSILDYVQLNVQEDLSNEVSEDIRRQFLAYEEAKDNFRDLILDVLTSNKITFYIEDDGTITIYE